MAFKDNESELFRHLNYWHQFSPAATAGIMGNIKVETNYDPTYISPDGNYGIFQWEPYEASTYRHYIVTTFVYKDDKNPDLIRNQVKGFYRHIAQQWYVFADGMGVEAFRELQDPALAAEIFERAYMPHGKVALKKAMATEIFSRYSSGWFSDAESGGTGSTPPAQSVVKTFTEPGIKLGKNSLFRQRKQLIINNSVIPDLDIDFNINFSEDDEQIINDVSIVNLVPETIKRVNIGDRVILNAGYGGNMSNVLAGKVADIEVDSGDVDRVVKLMVAPDINIILTKKVSKVYEPGVMASFIIDDVLKSVDVEVGTIKINTEIQYENGKSVDDPIVEILNHMVAETESFMFVRNNIIYIVDTAYEINSGILLNRSTGLIGSPETIDINGATGYKISCLLRPMLTTGSVFRLESKYLSGLFRVVSGNHDGSSFTTTVNCHPTDKVERYVPPVKEVDGGAEDTPKGRIWTFLINKGFSKAATAGIMGNVEWESHYDPNTENEIGAYGLFQWLGGRRSNLQAYATSKNIAVNDLYLQMDYFWYEITVGAELNCFNDYGGLEAFKNKTDPTDAAIVFEAAFERSGGSRLDKRIEYALAVFQWDGGGAKDTGGGGGSGGGGDGHFHAGAFKCECGCGGDIKPAMKDKMNQLWEKVGGGITVTSGFRCEYQNRIDGGVSDSLHMYGEAVDCYISGAGVDYLYNAAQSVGLGTIRYYSWGFVHCQLPMTDWVMN